MPAYLEIATFDMHTMDAERKLIDFKTVFDVISFLGGSILIYIKCYGRAGNITFAAMVFSLHINPFRLTLYIKRDLKHKHTA